jgi:hypothetical protein
LRSDRLLLLGLAFVAACEIEKVAIPSTPRSVVMHSVLSATSPDQVVLLERTYNGSVDTYLPPFDLESPFGADSGVAESGATVALIDPNGDTLFAHEDGFHGGPGAGVYRFYLPGNQLVRNATYLLRVVTAANESLSATTSVPDGAPTANATASTFNRASDTLAVQWAASAGARSYFVRIETPFGPRSFFTDSTHIRLTGELRNPEASGLPRVFFPGFPQAVTVSAVDQNFFDWYRSHNDEISGRGVINRVAGGLGVFGSLVRVVFDDYNVVVPQTEPEAGRWVLSATPGVPAPQFTDFLLYVESRSARSDQADALSGRVANQHEIGEDECDVCGVLGSVQGSDIRLAVLDGWYARDTLDVFLGQIHGDTLTGHFRNHGFLANYVRQ